MGETKKAIHITLDDVILVVEEAWRSLEITGKVIKVSNKMALICFIEKIASDHEIEEEEAHLCIWKKRFLDQRNDTGQAHRKSGLL